MQVAKIKKKLTFAQKKIAKLRNQLHQAKEILSGNEPSVVPRPRNKTLRTRQKQAKAAKPEPSHPTPPRKGFKMLPTGETSDSDEEEDYPEQNLRATYSYAKVKFARIRHQIMQEQTVQMEMSLSQ